MTYSKPIGNQGGAKDNGDRMDNIIDNYMK
jgi:hypothetical protein